MDDLLELILSIIKQETCKLILFWKCCANGNKTPGLFHIHMYNYMDGLLKNTKTDLLLGLI